MAVVNTIDLIKKHEGLRLKPYKCTAGKLTIGYGRNLEDNGITEIEAEMMLRNDVIECVSALQRNFPWFIKLSQPRQTVLIDMCFNLGINRLKQFVMTLERIQHGKYEEASKLMLESKWAKQVGQRAITLSNMMREG